MRGYVALLLLLAAIWGASFMFIKIAVDELAPTTTMALRLVFSAFPLLAIVFVKRGIRPAIHCVGCTVTQSVDRGNCAGCPGPRRPDSDRCCLPRRSVRGHASG